MHKSSSSNNNFDSQETISCEDTDSQKTIPYEEDNSSEKSLHPIRRERFRHKESFETKNDFTEEENFSMYNLYPEPDFLTETGLDSPICDPAIEQTQEKDHDFILEIARPEHLHSSKSEQHESLDFDKILDVSAFLMRDEINHANQAAYLNQKNSDLPSSQKEEAGIEPSLETARRKRRRL